MNTAQIQFHQSVVDGSLFKLVDDTLQDARHATGKNLYRLIDKANGLRDFLTAKAEQVASELTDDDLQDRFIELFIKIDCAIFNAQAVLNQAAAYNYHSPPAKTQ